MGERNCYAVTVVRLGGDALPQDTCWLAGDAAVMRRRKSLSQTYFIGNI